MPDIAPARPLENRILAALPGDERKVLQPHLEMVTLTFRKNLYEPNRPAQHVYFVHRGVVSLIAPVAEGMPVEIATVGPEGMVGLQVFLGDKQIANHAFVQIAGEGERMEADVFRRLITGCPTLNRLLLRYTLALMTQMAQSAACNRSHAVDERCARWLLMTHDRVQEPSFALTQEFLAQMLGVRRPTVSLAAGMLAKAGLISYVRGRMTILDRAGLEAASCECYWVIKGELDRLVGAREEAPLALP